MNNPELAFIFSDDMFDELMRITDELQATSDGADEETLQYAISRTSDALRTFLERSVDEYSQRVDEYILKTERREALPETDLTKLF
jgi:hypothetical protein|tara:strand:- start:449 stop:706 length:258 start_codon:yes stop_codon:yes gene_type:complete